MNTLLDEKILLMAAKHAEQLYKQDQLDMVETMFKHLAKEPRVIWLAYQYTAYCETVSDTDEQSSSYRSCVLDEFQVYASENGLTCDPSYDIERGLEDILEDAQQIWDYEIGRALLKTRKAFLSLLEHELSTDVS